MSKKKAVFFDIDGTLWDRRNIIPESTVRAIRKMRENGHLAFLCSGRTRAYIQEPALLAIGFDGIVSGCATAIEYDGKLVFYKRIEPELAEYTVRTVRSFGFRPILEGWDYLYFDDEEFGEDFYGQKLKAELGARRHTIREDWGRWEFSKMACATENADQQACFEVIKEEFDFMVHDETVVEIVPKGFHKGTGIKKVCELLGLDLADTFAFGDSANDLEMLRDAGVGIAMGNGSERVKALADYVTAPMHEDGIWKACRHFALI